MGAVARAAILRAKKTGIINVPVPFDFTKKTGIINVPVPFDFTI
jgi:hypothetical protein